MANDVAIIYKEIEHLKKVLFNLEARVMLIEEAREEEEEAQEEEKTE